MNKVENKKTDLEMANEALTALKPNVIATDRKECKYSELTVIRYLNGQGTQLSVAVELLEYFRERIKIRREIIASSK